MMYGYGVGGGWFGMMLMMFFGWMVIIGIALVILYVIRGSRPMGHRGMTMGMGEQDRALAIARERLAKGEITEEEYEKIKATLTRQ